MIPLKGDKIHFYFSRGDGSTNKETPRVVFIHGLGGQLEQFNKLFKIVERRASVLAIDLPGHGYSSISKDPSHYTLDYFASVVVDMVKHVSTEVGEYKRVLLIAHSYGSQVAANISFNNLLGNNTRVEIMMLAPNAYFSHHEIASIKKNLTYLPVVVLELIRWLDRIGGINSSSVSRMCKPGSSLETMRIQLTYNCHTPSISVKYTVLGMRAITSEPQELYNNLKKRSFHLVSPLNDTVCPHEKNGKKIIEWMELPEDKYTLLPDTGHAVMPERPEILVETTLKYIIWSLQSG